MPRTFALGRNCTLNIDATVVPEVADVLVREYTSEIDATGREHRSQSTVVTHRTYEVTLTIPDIKVARWVYDRRWAKNGDYWLPRILRLELAGGLISISDNFTIHDIDADEPIDGVVAPRFIFRQWGHE